MLTSFFIVGCGQREKHYQGYVEGENIYLTSSYAGKLQEILVSRGERVQAGSLLFKIDPNPELLVLQQAEAALTQAKRMLADLKRPRRPPEIQAIESQLEENAAQIKLALIRVKRNQILFEKNVIPKDTLDAANERYQELLAVRHQREANLKLAHQGARFEQIRGQRAQVKVMMEKMRLAQWQLQQKMVYAPADGLIYDTYMKKGEYVDNQHPVVSLLTPKNIYIEFFVPAEALPHTYVGKAITYLCDGCKATEQATIVYVSSRAEYIPPLVYSRENSDKIVFRVKASAKHPENIMPGQPVMISIKELKDES